MNSWIFVQSFALWNLSTEFNIHLLETSQFSNIKREIASCKQLTKLNLEFPRDCNVILAYLLIKCRNGVSDVVVGCPPSSSSSVTMSSLELNIRLAFNILTNFSEISINTHASI